MRALIAVGTVVGAVGVLVSTRSGMSLSPDSMNYLVHARNLADGEGFANFALEPETTWPPLYPAMLALLHLLGVDLLSAARLVNVVAIVASVWGTAALVERRSELPAVRAVAVLTVAASPILLQAGAYVWTEPLFIASSVWVFVAIDRHRQSQSFAWLAIAAVLAGASVLTRYTGVAVIAAGAVAVLVGHDGPHRRGLRQALTFGAMAAIPIALWLVRNALTDAPELLGSRAADGSNLIEVSGRVVRSLGALVLGEFEPLALELILGGVLATVVGVSVSLLVRAHRWTDAGLAALVLLYVAMVAVSNWRVGSSLNGRMVSPIVPFVAVVVASAWEQARTLPQSAKAALGAAGVVVVGLVALSGAQFVREARSLGDEPLEYASARWRQSELVSAVPAPDEVRLVSNHPAFLAYQVGVPVEQDPTEAGGAHPSFSELSRGACDSRTVLAWFGDELPDWSSSPDAPQLVLIGRYDDGALLAVDPPAGVCPPG